MKSLFWRSSVFVIMGVLSSVINAASVSITVGQQVSTGYVLPNGTPLKIRLQPSLASSGGFYYEPATIDSNAPISTLRGILEWFNLFSVTPLDSQNSNGLFSSTINDNRIPLDDPYGRSAVRNQIRLKGYVGSTFEFDAVSGGVLSVGGYGYPNMKANFVKNALTGGYWSAGNIKYKLTPPFSAVGNLIGGKDALGAVAAPVVPSQNNVILWASDSIKGPGAIPFADLIAAASVDELPAVLQRAGFTIVSTSTTEIVFSTTYHFLDLRATSDLIDYACVSWGCTPSAKNALSHPLTHFMGRFLAPVRLSISLVP
jgi:hypothetical protein